jgi:hypothetical protein
MSRADWGSASLTSALTMVESLPRGCALRYVNSDLSRLSAARGCRTRRGQGIRRVKGSTSTKHTKALTKSIKKRGFPQALTCGNPLSVGTAGFEPTTPCYQQQPPRACHCLPQVVLDLHRHGRALVSSCHCLWTSGQGFRGVNGGHRRNPLTPKQHPPPLQNFPRTLGRPGFRPTGSRAVGVRVGGATRSFPHRRSTSARP